MIITRTVNHTNKAKTAMKIGPEIPIFINLHVYHAYRELKQGKTGQKMWPEIAVFTGHCHNFGKALRGSLIFLASYS